MTLTDFLLARIAEDEHDATWAPDADWDGAARWVPARVLAECEAKRRIMARNDSAHNLRILAQPYADHPDYRDEWKLP